MFLIWLIWKFQVRCSSRYMPRYFVCFIIYKFWPIILKLSFLIFFMVLGPNRLISVLFDLSEIRFAINHWNVCTKSKLIYLFIFLSDLFEKRTYVLSGKWWINECETASFRSLIHVTIVKVLGQTLVELHKILLFR